MFRGDVRVWGWVVGWKRRVSDHVCCVRLAAVTRTVGESFTVGMRTCEILDENETQTKRAD